MRKVEPLGGSYSRPSPPPRYRRGGFELTLSSGALWPVRCHLHRAPLVTHAMVSVAP